MNMREVTIVCGMTETSPGSTQTSARRSARKRVNRGPATRHTEIKIVDFEGGSCAQAQRRNSAPRLLRHARLLERPRSHAKAIDPAGWMHTGDLAVMDRDDYVRIVGRIKDGHHSRRRERFIRAKVEEYLAHDSRVAEAQVNGVPCNRYARR